MSYAHDMEFHSQRMNAEMAKEKFYDEARARLEKIDVAEILNLLNRIVAALEDKP